MAEEYFLIYDYQRLIRVSDKAYPMYMPQVRASTTQTSFPMPIRDYILEPFGYMPVFDSELPTGDVVTEGEPELRDDGKWYKTWDVRGFTEEEVENNLIEAKGFAVIQASNVIANDIWSGITYNLNGTDYIVDVSADKLGLLLSIKSLAKDAEDSDIFPYSFMDGTVVKLTKQEFLNMWQFITTKVYDSYQAFWTFRDSINATTTIDKIPSIPETFKS